MTAIVCSKCGATGDSKNPYCRNIFQDNQWEALLSHILKHSVETDAEGHKCVAIRVWCSDSEWRDGAWRPKDPIPTEEDHIKEAYEWLYQTLRKIVGGEYPEGHDRLTLDQWLCDHDWIKANPDDEWEV